MKKLYKYASAATLGLLVISILSSSVMAAATDYLPKEADLVGYKLIYTADQTVADPFGTATEVSIGVQLWYRNESDTLKGVIGAIVLEIKDNPLMDKIPDYAKASLTATPGFEDLDLSDVETYWDLFVTMMEFLAPENFVDVTETIGTTESSLAIVGLGAYMIISVDTDYLVFTFGFTLDAAWIEAVAEDIELAMDGFLAMLTGITGTFGPFLSGASVPLPTASADQTPDSEVDDFTTEMGSFFEAGIPGYSGLIILGLVGAFVIYFAKKKVTIQ